MRQAAFRPAWAIAMLLGAILATARAGAEEARVAVAANFTAAAEAIAAEFLALSGHALVLSFGSSGQLYAQIVQGAPYDVFLSADAERPAMALAEGYGVEGSRFTYARGRLVLWSADPALVTGPDTLEAGGFDRLAIANPQTAPYGAAAVEAMRRLGVYGAMRDRIVAGNSVAQTHQFVQTGNAALGFVALAQVAGHGEGSRWIVPETLHAPIRQDAVLLREGAENPAARAFLDFLRGPQARAIIEAFGYGLEEAR